MESDLGFVFVLLFEGYELGIAFGLVLKVRVVELVFAGSLVNFETLRFLAESLPDSLSVKLSLFNCRNSIISFATHFS